MMEPRVLVAYATRRGSTAELADAIAEVLRDHNLRADVYAARDLAGLEPYSAVVVVAALYIGRLHGDARRFLTRHRRRLETLPVALFVPGPVANKEKDWTAARVQLDKELARLPWLAPVAAHVVGGVFDPRRLGFPYALIPALRRMPATDARDWEAIRNAAENMVGKFEAAWTVGA